MRTRRRCWSEAIGGLGAVCALALSCVGGENGARRADDGGDPPAERTATRRATTTVDYDTIPVAEYQIFQTVVESEQPRKLTVRLLAGGSIDRFSAAKTLRTVLDSVSRADSLAVATRAVLYSPLPGGAMEAELEPVAFALWVPPEGWEGASEDSRGRLHRTYVYHGVPDWPVPSGETGEGRSDE